MNQDRDRNPPDTSQDQDLRRNPGIGQSPGTFATGEDVESIEGDNTVKGDVENDSTAGDGVSPREGRTNA